MAVSESQNMVALARANEYRIRRAALRGEINDGTVRLSELLREVEPPIWLLGEPIGRLVLAMDRIGPTRMRRLLVDLDISERREIGKMTYRQRRRLSAELAKWESRIPSGRRARLRNPAAGRRTAVLLSHRGGE